MMEEKLCAVDRIDGLGDIVESTLPWPEALQTLRDNRIKDAITFWDFVYARLNTKTDYTRHNSARTMHGIAHKANDLPLLVLDSPLNNKNLARMAADANDKGEYFHTENTILYDSLRERAEAEVANGVPNNKRTIFILPNRFVTHVSPSENSDIYEGLFREKAANKGAEYFALVGISYLKISPVGYIFVNEQSGTLLTQAELFPICENYKSLFSSDGSSLNCDLNTFAVQKEYEKVVLPASCSEPSKN